MIIEHSKDIIEAYGKYYNIVKNSINEDGWYFYFAMNYENEKQNLRQFKGIKFEYNHYLKIMRPLILSSN